MQVIYTLQQVCSDCYILQKSISPAKGSHSPFSPLGPTLPASPLGPGRPGSPCAAALPDSPRRPCHAQRDIQPPQGCPYNIIG